MNIVIFTHPKFHNSLSMSKYAGTLTDEMRSRNHTVELCTPSAFFYRIPLSGKVKKWLGYIDSFIVFPIKFKLKNYPVNTLFVFSDQALAPWIYLVKNNPLVIHCHDFMALKSALGFFDENPVSWSGKIYQNLIRKGFMKGENFISVSKKTEEDLLSFLPDKPASSIVVYNQVAPLFKRKNKLSARNRLAEFIGKTQTLLPELGDGFILNVGVDVWYKNKRGVLELYAEWRKITQKNLPLVMVGKPGEHLKALVERSNFNSDFIVMENIPQEILVDAYCGASVFIFPSFEEGFGWPIAEAMACGCPVITTNLAPMTEVGGNAAYYIERRPQNVSDLPSWAQNGAKLMEDILNFTPKKLEKVIQAGLKNNMKFQTTTIVDQTEAFYKSTLELNNS